MIPILRGTLLAALLLAAPLLALGACAPDAYRPGSDDPEAARGPWSPRPGARALHQMVVAGHPLAAEAGRAVLREGGSAVDAAIAAILVLNVVEPQSSGIGGGGFLVHYAALARRVETYDGRETAPAAATPDMFQDADGRPLPFEAASRGGLAVGAPGLVRMLELAHRDHGRLTWARLVAPAIRAAEDGVAITPRLNRQLEADPTLRDHPAAAAHFYGPDGRAKPAGTILKNPALAQTLRAIAEGGAEAFHAGPIAADIASTVRAAGGRLTAADIASTRALKREAVCALHRAIVLCGAPPPSSGPLAVLQILGMWRQLEGPPPEPGSAAAAHAFAELLRLAFADRNAYVADPDFAAVPTAPMLADIYLRARALRVSPDRRLDAVKPGLGRAHPLAPETSGRSTTHLSVLDKDGNLVALTASIEQQFGSGLMVRGFLLNNQLTDFAFVPEAGGQAVANRVEPKKRPRSSMSPMVGFGADGRPVVALGSPGGPAIIAYVAKALLGVLEWGLEPQRAIEMPNLAERGGTTVLEAGTEAEALAPALEALGHRVRLAPMPSGLNMLLVRDGAILGATDPRRDGEALGD